MDEPIVIMGFVTFVGIVGFLIGLTCNQEAVNKEREECAILVEDMVENPWEAQDIAKRIRARGK